MPNLFDYDSLELLVFLLEQRKQLPLSLREVLIDTLVNSEVEHILGCSLDELKSEVRSYGLLSKIEELPDYHLIQECWDRDLPHNSISFHDAIRKSLTSIEYLNLIEQWETKQSTQTF